ncbi:MAG: Ni/Fe hydrogenase subunit alpha [Candidatus Diapherotrites archaeon]|nr:Ni/Fe hydrogenase subunit alpha [Candidatus Diapherotrites archaeon]
MHKDGHFSICDITKIEGHANLDVQLKNGVVTKCEFRVAESHRFFEDMAIGKSFKEIPLIVSRICGLCCYSHLHTAIEAAEKALGVTVSEQTKALRNVTSNMEHLKSHALHVYMLALPDYLHRESVLKFNEKEHQYLHDALDIKKAATDVLNILAARTYHTVNPRVGGFSLLPKQSDLDEIPHILGRVRKTVLRGIELFAGFEAPFKRKANYAALSGKGYELLEGVIKTASGKEIQEEDFLEHFEEIILPYSTAKGTKFMGQDYRVGALARVNLNQGKLCAGAKKAIKDFNLKFPSDSPFHNNIAQLLEMLHIIDTSIEIICQFKIRSEPLEEIKPVAGKGIGVTEAPRGLLFHSYTFDDNGFIKSGNIVVPTNQNNPAIEADLHEFIPNLVGLPHSKADIEIEKLIRAYDPCISCSTHFLKVKWQHL